MNPAGANLPALETVAPPDEGWSRKRFLFWITVALAGHLALIFAFGTKKPFVPRPVTDVPQFFLAERANVLLELDNPALFALPNPRDFSAAIWQRPLVVSPPPFRWQPTPGELTKPSPAGLGANLTQFVQTNRFGDFQLDFKPPPLFAEFASPISTALPQSSTLSITGDLARRTILSQPDVPTLVWNDVIAPSRVRVTVLPTGTVLSAVLLPSDSDLEDAGRSAKGDTNALALARSLKFAPAPELQIGEVIFTWHTVPLQSTNTTIAP